MDSINIQTSNTNKVLYGIEEFNDINVSYIYSLISSLGLFPLITLVIYLYRQFVETSIIHNSIFSITLPVWKHLFILALTLSLNWLNSQEAIRFKPRLWQGFFQLNYVLRSGMLTKYIIVHYKKSSSSC